ncbi:MAG TPA: RNA 2',3'-cyclic phosphodiesterase [Solirubrobacteraceae bacterium]|jgi:2'-5' RNA ligase|nr:RNA 2',3'-cyclic phosphodiesterase [Solirubrobacteraceae bacterium]
MSARGASARLFVAVDPPAQVRDSLASWAKSAARGLRILDAELLHVTVCFLGERPLQELDAIADELSRCARPAVELSLGAPLWLPPRRPRALAVELHDRDGTLAKIHAELLDRLHLGAHWQQSGSRASGSSRSDGRAGRHRFRPHVTVARMRPEEAPRDRALPPTPAQTFSAVELVLYRSWLSPEGASYERLSACPLGE